MLQDISSQAKEHRRAEECLADNMGPIASILNQQGHSELHKKEFELGVDTLNMFCNKLKKMF